MLKNNEFLEADNFSAYTVAGKLEKMKNYVITNAIQGPQGPRGPQGVQGVKGDAGPQGERGEQGVQGIQGVKGDAGPQGEQGEKGEQGVQGIQGVQGVQGDAGQQGERGPQGEQGVQGPQGIQGETGIQGIQGSQGPQGPQGSKGDKGVSGNDFTIQGTVSSTVSLPNDLTVADVGVAYFVGTSIPRSIFSWGYLESGLLGWVNQGTLQGPQGEQGVQGPQGIQGETGIQGIQGEQGPQGEQGVQGVKGDKGEQGPQGIQGVQGEQGIQGPAGVDGFLFTDVSRPLTLDTSVDLTSGDLFNMGYIKSYTMSYTASGTDSDINELAGKYYFAYLGKADNSVNSVALFGKFGVNNFGSIYSSVANGGFKNYSDNYETDLLVKLTVTTIINSKISVTLYSKKSLTNITNTINNIIIRGF